YRRPHTTTSVRRGPARGGSGTARGSLGEGTMRRLGTGVWAAAVLGMAVAAASAQKPAGGKGSPPADTGSTWGKLFGNGDKPDRVEEVKPEAPTGGPSPAESATREQARQRNAYLRRMLVCDRLRQIAQETNDADLERQADELQEQAWAVYQKHTA